MPSRPAAASTLRRRSLSGPALFGLVLAAIVAGCAAPADDVDRVQRQSAQAGDPLREALRTRPSASLREPTSTPRDRSTTSSDPILGADVPAKVPPAGIAAYRSYGRDLVSDAAPNGSAAAAGAPIADGAARSVAFERADIRDAARLVLEDALGLAYVVDPQVTGETTLSTAGPLAPDALLAAFEAALAQNGAALLPPSEAGAETAGAGGAGVWRIVPRGAATALAEPAAGRPGFGVRAFRLRELSATAMADILRPLLPDGALLRVDDALGLLTIVGASADLQRAERLIRSFDVDRLAGRSVGLFPLRAAGAAALVDELDLVFDLGAAAATREAIAIEALERLNAVLVVADQPAALREAEAWIERLDANARAARRAFVYRVRHADPIALAAMLNDAFGDGAARGAPPRPLIDDAPIAPGLQETSVDAAFPGLGAAPLTSAPDGGPRAGRVRADPAGPGRDLPSPSALPPARLAAADTAAGFNASDVRIIAAPDDNALLILAAEPDRRAILAALRDLDAAPAQVIIEATVAEVSLSDSLRFGLQFFLEDDLFDVSVGAQLNQGVTPGAIAPPLPGFAITIGNPIKAILDALDGVTDVNVISSPHLMVLENETAELSVGAEVPVARQQRQGASDDAALVNTIEFRNTGVILRVTPRVGADGVVTMEVEQEVSSVAAGEATTLTPTISTRRFRSVVTAADGATVALGGLFQTSASRTRSGLPVLQDAPVIGPLFGRRTRETERTELLVLITPRVAPNPAAASGAAEEMRAKLDRILTRVGPTAPPRRDGLERAIDLWGQ